MHETSTLTPYFSRDFYGDVVDCKKYTLGKNRLYLHQTGLFLILYLTLIYFFRELYPEFYTEEFGLAEEIFWKRVKSQIKEKKMTQKELAASCAINPRTFQNWIRRSLFPDVENGYRIACFLGVTVEYLITGKNNTTMDHIKTIRSQLKKVDEQLQKIRE